MMSQLWMKKGAEPRKCRAAAATPPPVSSGWSSSSEKTDIHSEPASRLDEGADLFRVVVEIDDETVDAGRDEPEGDPLEHRCASDLDERLRNLLREGPKAPPDPCGEDHPVHSSPAGSSLPATGQRAASRWRSRIRAAG